MVELLLLHIHPGQNYYYFYPSLCFMYILVPNPYSLFSILWIVLVCQLKCTTEDKTMRHTLSVLRDVSDIEIQKHPQHEPPGLTTSSQIRKHKLLTCACIFFHSVSLTFSRLACGDTLCLFLIAITMFSLEQFLTLTI